MYFNLIASLRGYGIIMEPTRDVSGTHCFLACLSSIGRLSSLGGYNIFRKVSVSYLRLVLEVISVVSCIKCSFIEFPLEDYK